MEKKTVGTVIFVKRQWWLKINTKPVRTSALDGATFPHIVKVRYFVNSVEYVKSKWLGASVTPPAVNDSVTVIYRTDNPARFRIQK